MADLITVLTSNAQQSLTLYLVFSVCTENLRKENWVLWERVIFWPKLSSHDDLACSEKDSTSLTPLSEIYGKILNALYNQQRAG